MSKAFRKLSYCNRICPNCSLIISGELHAVPMQAFFKALVLCSKKTYNWKYKHLSWFDESRRNSLTVVWFIVTVTKRSAAMVSVIIIIMVWRILLTSDLSIIEKNSQVFLCGLYSPVFSEKLILGKSHPLKYIKIRKVILKLAFIELSIFWSVY